MGENVVVIKLLKLNNSMANLAIKGHETRGKEVIQILEMLGGKNVAACTGTNTNKAYVLTRYGSNNIIDYVDLNSSEYNLCLFTIEEYFEKFPYKAGDKVQRNGATSCGSIYIIEQMRWEDNQVKYVICDLYWKNCKCTVISKDLQPYKEETMEEQVVTGDITLEKSVMCTFLEVVEGKQRLRIAMNEGFELKEENGNFFVYRKKVEYPKTYEECCKILDWNHRDYGRVGYNSELLCKLQALLLCRDAYWKIAGEQMGLGKPWEPKWEIDNVKYSIIVVENEIRIGDNEEIQRLLVFPTEEMRDIFLENFKELIEICKKFL